MIAQVFLNGVLSGALIGLLALGFTLVVRTAHIIHIAHAATFVTGGYVGLYFLETCNLSPFISACTAMAAGASVGFLIEFLVYRPLRHQEASSLSMFLASLAVVIVIQNVIGIVFGNEIQVANFEFNSESISIFGARITVLQSHIILVYALAFFSTTILLYFTKNGKLARAIGSDADLAMISGLNIENVLMKVTIFSALLGGLSGFLTAFDQSITPYSGLNLILLAITAAIVGGVGSVPGALVGGLVVGVTRNIAGWQLPSQWQDAIVFMLLLVILVIRPQGLFGKPMRRSTT